MNQSLKSINQTTQNPQIRQQNPQNSPKFRPQKHMQGKVETIGSLILTYKLVQWIRPTKIGEEEREEDTKIY